MITTQSGSGQDVYAEALAKCQEAEFCLARARAKGNRPELIQRAIDLYSEVLALDIEVADAYLGIAIIVFGAGSYEQAEAMLLHAEALEPANLRISQLRSHFATSRKRALAVPAVEQSSGPVGVGSLRARRAEAEARDAGEQVQVDTEINPEIKPEPESRPEPDTISVVLGPPASKMYAKGPQVRLLQSWLQELGETRVSLSGEYDAATLKAVQTLQMKHKLKVSGLTDRKTVDVLQTLLARKRARASLQAASGPEDHGRPPVQPARLVLGRPGSGKDILSEGLLVSTLQQSLLNLGFRLELSGSFDQPTFTAVRSLQSRHRLPITGIVGPETRKLLEQLAIARSLRAVANEKIIDALAESPLFADSLTETQLEQLPRLLDRIWSKLEALCHAPGPDFKAAAPAAAAASRPLLTGQAESGGEAGMVQHGPDVKLLQALLIELGYTLRPGEGFDFQTQTALRQYQQDQGLEPCGSVDVVTRQRLNHRLEMRYAQLDLNEAIEGQIRAVCGATGWPVPAEMAAWRQQLIALAQGAEFEELLAASVPVSEIRAELGPAGRPDRLCEGPEVELLQIWLRRLGRELAISGLYDQATATAVRQFQTQNKLPMTGVCDGRTARALRALLISDPFDT
ncbi:MAG: peptidoglycan-binding protein [Candidatus Sericytochromatia bacterium]